MEVFAFQRVHIEGFYCIPKRGQILKVLRPKARPDHMINVSNHTPFRLAVARIESLSLYTLELHSDLDVALVEVVFVPLHRQGGLLGRLQHYYGFTGPSPHGIDAKDYATTAGGEGGGRGGERTVRGGEKVWFKSAKSRGEWHSRDGVES